MITDTNPVALPVIAESVNTTKGTDISNWFHFLFGECQDGWMTIAYKQKCEQYFQTKWFKTTQLTSAIDMAKQLSSQKKDVYFGLGLRRKKLDSGRGKVEDVRCITCLWADIDVKADAHKETNLPQGIEEAVDFVNSFPLLPSVIINSGHGLHAYWLLNTPWDLDEAENLRAKQLMSRFQGLLKDKGKENGWKLDNTSDLARILRVPGTLNYKYPEQPIKVEILEAHPERRYTIEKVEEFLPIAEPIQPQIDRGLNPDDSVRVLVENCAFIQHCRDNAVNLHENDWFAMVSNLCRLEKGNEVIHQFSRSYTGYSVEETDEKIRHCLQDGGPHTCEYIQDKVGFHNCPSGGCGVKSPIAMATSAVFKAKLVLRKLWQGVASQPTAAFNQEYVSALGVLKNRDKAEYGKAIVEFRELAGKKLNIKHLESAVDEAVRKWDKQQSATNIFEGLPYEFTVPENWVVTTKGIQAWTKEGKITVSPTPITIARRLKNVDENTEKVELFFKRDNRWRTIRTERSTICSKTKIVDLANFGLPVTSETARLLVKYLADVEAANDIPVISTINRLGWINDREFVPSLSNIILDAEGGNAKLADAFKPSGTLEEWIDLVNPMRGNPLSRFVLSAGFAAPMMQPLKQRNFALHIWGDSRAGKSAVAKAALSVWGNPHQGMMTFNTTGVGLEQQVGFLSNLPLVIDEKQIVAVANKQSFVESLLYMLGEGKGRTRGNKTGGLANYQNWRTLAITTGEHPMSDTSSATGVKSRVLELHSQSVVPESYGSKLHQRLDSVYGTAGSEFIRRLIDYSELSELFQSICKKLQEQTSDLMGSHQSALALIATADVLVSQWIFAEDEDTAVNDCWAMLETIAKQLETKSEADEATRAIMHFHSWMQENTRRFDCDARYEYGWIEDGNTVFINSGTFTRAMKDGGFNAIRVKADFLARQWLIPHINSKGKKVDYKSKRNPDRKNAMVIEIRLPLLA
ncbi:DUF927 domain-containing protein [Sporomusa sphaeroides]|uniref:DUF927 domain-containing protein n=1 Tax=Sporomusa sphaeroides DSM 2875 TaxID=1337886 RepID=A0ABM9VZZ8_9FIRM|nr:DUF927 domain-containing protein [Sporomusa sphaeroides]OLS56314.1 hypothetical protein SPSPH_27070 [Sporomusa sphaeroides DSM 2875]CVK18409.1 hypothetical protein SSPH_01047 [Sporomusa sphaeroides DSM 2875]